MQLEQNAPETTEAPQSAEPASAPVPRGAAVRWLESLPPGFEFTVADVCAASGATDKSAGNAVYHNRKRLGLTAKPERKGAALVYVVGQPPAPAETVDTLVSTILDAVAKLQKLTAHPPCTLAQFNNDDLILELHKRMGAASG